MAASTSCLAAAGGCRSRPELIREAMEFGVDLSRLWITVRVAVRVAVRAARAGDGAKLADDVEGLLPSVAGPGDVAGGVVGVAEMVENNGLARAIGKFPVQGEGLLEES